MRQMLQSTPAYIKCYECKKSPKQFTFLICNHIICGKCIKNRIQTTPKYNLVHCQCGNVTYFNEDNEVIQQTQTHNLQTKNKNKSLSKDEKQRRLTFDQKCTAKNNQATTHQYSKTYVNDRERSTMPVLQVSSVFSLNQTEQEQEIQYDSDDYRPSSPSRQRFLNGSSINLAKNKTGTQKTTYDESLLLQTQKILTENKRSPQLAKRQGNNEAINQFSTHCIHETNQNSQSYSEYEQNMLKKLDNNNRNRYVDISKIVEKFQQVDEKLYTPQPQPKHLRINLKKISNKDKQVSDGIHYQFQNELEFLSILFKKDMEQIDYHYRKIQQQLNESYNRLEQQLRSLYVEQVITSQSLNSLNLSHLIKKKYQSTFGEKFKQLKDKLFLVKGFQKFDYNNTQSSQIQKKPLIYLEKFQNQQRNYDQKVNDTRIKSNHNLIDSYSLMRLNNQQDRQQSMNGQVHGIVAQDRKNNGNKQNENIVNMKFHDQQQFDYGKRVQTQNIHTNIKRGKQQSNSRQRNERPTLYSSNEINSEQCCRLTQKPNYNPDDIQQSFKYASPSHIRSAKYLPYNNIRQNQEEDEYQKYRRHVIYYSPPLPSYCERHLKKRSKEAKNYISYIQKLCHQKKMKNNRELFKKVKQNHPYEFKNRYEG